MLAPWKKSYDKPTQPIKKQRHHFGDGPSSQSYGFSSSHVQMWELDHKKAEHQRIDEFKLWWWRRFLRFSWTARRSNKSILKEINPRYSLEGLMLKLQYFSHLMRIAESLVKNLILGKTESKRKGRQDEMVGWHHWLSGPEFEQTRGYREGQGSPTCFSSWSCKELDIT